MTQDEAKKVLGNWFGTTGGLEVTFTSKEPETGRTGNPVRFPVVAFGMGKKGFAWYQPEANNPHVAKIEKIGFDSFWESMMIVSDAFTLEIQPLRLEELVSFVEAWKKKHPNAIASLMIDLGELANGS